jgi:hypothetical protein
METVFTSTGPQFGPWHMGLLTPSSASSCRGHRRKHDSAIPKSSATCLSEACPDLATWTTSARNFSGYAFGIGEHPSSNGH